MEHSRLLKFLTEERNKTIMADSPSYKIQREYENPPNISAEVPGEQEIREVGPNYEEYNIDTNTCSSVTDTVDTNTCSSVKDTEFTLSPVITVTKKETTLTKGDMKLQKVTVTEDIAEMENGDQRMSYTEFQTIAHSNSQTIQRTISTTSTEQVTEEVFEVEEKVIEPKKSRIPQLKFKQTVEKVNKQRNEQNSKNQPHKTPRRSSIPKLKPVRRASSFKEELSNDEFDKIYDEIVDDKQKDVDEKVLAVKIDDPVKIETKFEEIIHAYDSNDDSLSHAESLKLSKIPWRKKNSAESKIGSLVEKVKNKNASSSLKDGGFKVSATTITTKRFSRGSSMEFSHNQKSNIVQASDANNDIEDVKEKVGTETIEGRPVKTKVTLPGISRGISYGDTDDTMDINQFEFPQDNSQETVKVEEFEGGRKITKEIITRQSIKTGIPIKPERNRNISRDLNRRPATLDDRDFVNREVIKHEVLKDSTSRTTVTETVVKEIPIRTEKMTRNISRTFSRDGKSITVSSKMKEPSNERNKTNVENDKSTATMSQLDKSKTDNKQESLSTENSTKDSIKISTPVIKQPVSKTENSAKDNIKIAKPVITKTTHSYSKGSIKNIERSKSIEWRAADEIRTKSYVRSHSEHTSKLDRRDKKINSTVDKKETILGSELPKEEDPMTQYKDTGISNDVNENNVQVNDTKDAPTLTSTIEQSEVNTSLKPFEETTEINKNISSAQQNMKHIDTISVQNKDITVENVTVLKGNVSRLITQISVKENIDVSKKDIDLDENILKKKSVLSKIAMFEGKEPTELSVKVKKCTTQNKASTLVAEDDIEGKTNTDLQPKMDSNDHVNKIEFSEAEAREINNEPIIVDQIWKVQEQNIENISVSHNIEHVKVLPVTIDFTVAENAETNNNSKIELADSSQTEINFNTEIKQIEPHMTLPGKLDFQHNENQEEGHQLLHGMSDVDRDERTPEISLILPAKIDFIPNESRNSIVKYSPETIVTQELKSQEAVKKPGVGKLNLDSWNKKVETNKQFVGKGKYIKTSNTLSAKTVDESDRPKSEKATILPAKIEFATSEEILQEAMKLPQVIDFTVDDTNISTTVINLNIDTNHVERITLLPDKIDFVHDDQMQPGIANIEEEKRQLDVTRILPAKLDFYKNESLDNSIEYLPEIVNIQNTEKLAEVKRPRVGKLNLDLWNKQVEVNKQHVGKGKHYEPNTAQDKISKIVSGKTFNEKKSNEVENVPKVLPGKSEITSESQGNVPETIAHNITQTEMPTILPSKNITKSMGQNELPTILPGKIAFTPNIGLREVPNIFVSNENQLTDIQSGIPETTDTTIIESNNDINSKILTTDKSQDEQAAILPIKLDFVHSEKPADNPQMEPADTYNERDEIRLELAAALPAKLDFNGNESAYYTIERLPEKMNTLHVEKQVEEKRPRVGKLDLSLWIKKVEDSKPERKPKILHEKSVYKKPANLDITNNINSSEVTKILQERIDFTEYEGQLTVPVDRPDTPLGKAGEIDFNPEKSKIEIPDMNELKATDYDKDVITAAIESSNVIERPIVLPERIDFELERNQNESPRNIDSSSTEVLKTTEISYEIEDPDKEIASDPELVDSEPEIAETTTSVLSRFNNKLYSSNANYIAVRTEHETSKTSVSPSAEEITSQNDSINNQNILLDTYNEVGKMEFITTTRDEQYNTTENYTNIHENLVENYNFEVGITETNRKEYRTRMKSYSIVEKVGCKSTEEMKRSKSLAELDLGDAVKGQVQRMLFRIKSGDYERAETRKNRKISLREMPIKCSVSEKIALFEGKSSSSTSLRLEKTIEITTSTNSSKNASNFLLNQTQSSEEVYLRKIEELSSAKMRYNKSEMLYLNLGNGEQMPAIALGTALLDSRLTPHIVAAAIDLGYRAIDTAYIYGNERDVGQAIKSKIDDGTVKREDLYIMSKLWSTFHDPSLVETACRASLEAMGLDYFDLYMIHNPMSFKEGGDPIPKIATVLQFSEHDYLDAWFGMEALVSKGLVRSIGVSNFNSQQIQRILDKGRIRPLVNQVECHPYLTQHNLDAFCKERNITLSCYSVLGSKGTPKEYKSEVAPAIDDPLIKVMASGLNVTAARLLVRYQIQSGRQAVVKSSSAEHLWDVLQALTFVLEPHEIDAISALNRNKRIFTFKGMGHLHKNYPFNIPF